MYSFIKGAVVEKQENLVVIENNGIGFEIIVSNNTLDNVGPIGQQVKIHTYYHVREDQAVLFGFSSLEEKNMFLKLTKVSGIGPKMAITILSGISISDLAITIISGDTALLNKVKGVGKKTAERIILELKEKVEDFDTVSVTGLGAGLQNDSAVNDASFALVALGINKAEALRLVRKVALPNDSAEVLIEKALKSFSR
ncbi:MAG: Holliday junction branch migration protein RuvA [Spirochaetales bacterium]